MAMYNPVTDSFTYYTPVEPKEVKLDLPLLDEPVSLPWASRIANNGSVIVSNNTSQQQDFEDIFSYIPEQENTEIIDIQNKSYDSHEKQTPVTNNIKGDQKKLAVDIVNSLIDKSNNKIKPEQASAIVGHLIAESKLIPSKINSKDLGEISGGLGQWRDDRFDNLKQFARKQGKTWNNLDTQVDFLLHELNNNYSDVYNNLLNTNNPVDASKIWSYYEKFAGYDGKISSARKLQKSKGWSDAQTMKWIKDQHNNRETYSKEVYELWKKSKES